MLQTDKLATWENGCHKRSYMLQTDEVATWEIAATYITKTSRPSFQICDSEQTPQCVQQVVLHIPAVWLCPLSYN